MHVTMNHIISDNDNNDEVEINRSCHGKIDESILYKKFC